MKQFYGRILICLIPLLLGTFVVARAFNAYLDGKGGFRLGVDLVGGTILIYEVDESKFPDGKLPSDWNPQELARRLKSRIDPNDLYNISIRVIGKTRFEIILPTGGQHQVQAEEKLWKEIIARANQEYPIKKYVVPVGHRIELLADIWSQYAGKKIKVNGEERDATLEDINKFIDENWKKPADTAPESEKGKAWQALLEKANEAYPPMTYEVGRGRVTELGNEITQQYPDAPLDKVRQVINPDEGKSKSKREALTSEQVQERKELIAQQGSLEFRILANPTNDEAAIKQARAFFTKAKDDQSLKDMLARLAFAGKPPPAPTPEGGGDYFETPLGRFTYSWVELGQYFRSDRGLANPRDKSGRLLDLNNEADRAEADRLALRNREAYGNWRAAFEARKEGMPFELDRDHPSTSSLIWSREVKNPRLPEKDREKRYEYFVLVRDPENPEARITGEDLSSAAPGMEGDVNFRLKTAGGDRFYELTSKNKSAQLAIVLDGMVESAATIQSAIRTSGRITGHFTQQKIDELVRILRAGALPGTLKRDPVSENTMGPTLGADTIKWGGISVVLAFGVVLIFMVIYYWFAGVVACVALMANLILTVAFMVMINAAFTLPGLAGLVLMLGMAVDANVLIYERLREERARGASLALALRNGYDRAFPTIIDTHLSSIFTAIVLYVVGNDQLKGFGISLTVGLIISLFTSLYMTRVMFDVWQYKGWLKKLTMLHLIPSDPKIDFMRIRYYFFAATVILTILGAGLFVYRLDRGGLNIDFVGGTAYSAELSRPADIDELTHLLANSGLPDQSIEQTFISAPGYSEGTKSKLFTLRTSEKDVNKVQDAINNSLGEGPDGKGPNLLKKVNLAGWEFLPDKKEVELWFTDPVTGHPAFASRAQVSMILQTEMAKHDVLKPIAQQLTVDGMGKDNEGRFQFMAIRTLEPLKDREKAALETALEETQKDFKARPLPERLENFDSQLATETQLRALYAILASWGAILLYLWFRFGSWTFGMAAVLCLIHDLFFTLGVIAGAHYLAHTGFGRALLLEDFKIDLASVAALLTLVGYSVNDTIVVFDRIREVRGKNPALTPQMINDSVNQTLSRTILTSFATWLVVVVLYIIGGEGVHLFAFVMVIGVIVGTYSSIYIASPLLLMFGEGSQAVPQERAPTPQPAGTQG
jgi:SecD/SecF fusion protein